MKRRPFGGSVCCTLLAVLLGYAGAWAQNTGQSPPPRPPEVEKLVQLAKDPDRLRQALTDPQKVQEFVGLMESDAVREYLRDPDRVRELMSEVNVLELSQVMQGVDLSLVRTAATARWLERLRKQLGASDEEWKVIAPKIEQLLRAQQDARAGVRGIRGVGGGGGGGGGGDFGRFAGGGPAEPSEFTEAARALREALQDPDVPDRDRAILLAEYRKAREKARQRVTQVEGELRDLLTQRQEAILVNMGLME